MLFGDSLPAGKIGIVAVSRPPRARARTHARTAPLHTSRAQAEIVCFADMQLVAQL